MENIKLPYRMDVYRLENDWTYYMDYHERNRTIQRLRHMTKEDQEIAINDMVSDGLMAFGTPESPQKSMNMSSDHPRKVR